jgi:hypothetical protein
MIITLPTHLSLMDWADQISLDLDSKVPVQKLLDNNNWQAWAEQYVLALQIGGNNIPNPYQFEDWRIWADGFCKALQA